MRIILAAISVSSLFILTACAGDGGGGTCSSQSDCDPGTACTAGVCLAVCVEDGDCPPGDSCESSVCQAGSGSEGESCSSNDQCGAGTCVANTCTTLRTVGGTCDAGDSDDCGGALACSLGFCLVAEGDACTANSDCPETCLTGTCETRSGTGGDCDLGDQTDCGTGLECDGVVCRPGAGASCAFNSECAGTCVDGLCADPGAVGDDCDDDDDCQTGGTSFCDYLDECRNVSAATVSLSFSTGLSNSAMSATATCAYDGSITELTGNTDTDTLTCPVGSTVSYCCSNGNAGSTGNQCTGADVDPATNLIIYGITNSGMTDWACGPNADRVECDGAITSATASLNCYFDFED